MNYRHAYHAGNHTEILKHAVLVRILTHLRQKEKPFFVLDTHAGLAVYDLKSKEARKTSEAGLGIIKVINRELPSATDYLEFVRSLNVNSGLTLYPGSPTIICAFLRGQDRMVACELHPEDSLRLQSHFQGDKRVSVYTRDGYAAIRGFVPPPQRRGLVFIDPPYENRSEFEDLGNALVEACRRWPTRIYAAWYPVKSRAAIANFRNSLRAAKIPECLSVELTLRPANETELVGGGMILINPPWQTDTVLRKLGPEILDALDAPEGRVSIEWITPPT